MLFDGGDIAAVRGGRGLEKSAGVDVADDDLGHFANFLVGVRRAQLAQEMLLKRLHHGDGIEHELALLLCFCRARGIAAALHHVLAPLFVDLGEFCEFLVEIVFAQILLLDGNLRRCVLQHRVDGQLLAHHLLELERRRLQDLEALLHLRRDPLLLSLPQRGALIHLWSRHPGCLSDLTSPSVALTAEICKQDSSQYLELIALASGILSAGNSRILRGSWGLAMKHDPIDSPPQCAPSQAARRRVAAPFRAAIPAAFLLLILVFAAGSSLRADDAGAKAASDAFSSLLEKAKAGDLEGAAALIHDPSNPEGGKVFAQSMIDLMDGGAVSLKGAPIQIAR